MIRFELGLLVLSAALLLAALLNACSVGGDEPWDAQDGGGGDSDSDGDTDSEVYDLQGDDCYESTTVLVPGTYDGNTEGMANDYAGSCGGAGPDLVMMFELAQAGTFTAAVTACEIAEAVLYVREVCTDSETELACELGIQSQAPSLAVELEAGFYFLIVDGQAASDAGGFTVEIGVE